MSRNKLKAIKNSELNSLTLKRILFYFIICCVGFLMGMVIYSLYPIDKELVISNIGVILIVIFLVISPIIESKYLWRKVIFVYPVHDRDVQPLGISFILGYLYNIFF